MLGYLVRTDKLVSERSAFFKHVQSDPTNGVPIGDKPYESAFLIAIFSSSFMIEAHQLKALRGLGINCGALVDPAKHVSGARTKTLDS